MRSFLEQTANKIQIAQENCQRDIPIETTLKTIGWNRDGTPYIEEEKAAVNEGV